MTSIFLHSLVGQYAEKEQVSMLDAVMYNIKQLLECEAPLMMLEPQMRQAQQSLLTYGVEDMQSLNYQLGKNVFANRLKRMLMNFEHRIENLDIQLLPEDSKVNCIRFAIVGDLVSGQGFMFNSELNVSDFSLTMEQDFV